MANYGTITVPLTRLMKNNGFQWSKEATMAFGTFQKAMVTLLVLVLSDFNLPFEIDASGFGLGAVLSQNKKPIAYFSQKLSVELY